jgi:secretion/DNA translocation related TadE-like protein
MIRAIPRRSLGSGRDAGSASILVLAIGLSIMMVAMGVMAVGDAIVARHRAQAAADFGALAGALVATSGPAFACGRARELVGANGARMVSCEMSGLDVIVRAEVDAHGGWGAARASARAGPDR